MIRHILHTVKQIIHINWIKTLYLNFRLLPFKQAIKFPFVIFGKTKLRELSGKATFNCPIKFRLINIGLDVDNMPITFAPTQIKIQGNLEIGGNIIINKGANFVVWPNASMKLGNDVMICSGVTLKATNKVTVGNHVMISSGCFIMDNSIHCIYNTATCETSAPYGEIYIGNNVWLNMYTDIIKNGYIPNGCITTRYTFINKTFSEDNSNCILAGQPAKIIKAGYSQIHNFTTEKFINNYFRKKNNKKVISLTRDQLISENLVEKIIS